MKSGQFADQAAKKAFELGYAVYRLSGFQKNRPIADYMEKEVLNVLEAATRSDFDKCAVYLKSLEYVTRLGVEAGVLNYSAGQVIVGEIRKFQTAIAEHIEVIQPDDLHILNIKRQTDEKTANDNSQKANISKKSETRQTAILDIIRQNGNCRLKDLQNRLPEFSERTIRNDVTDLMDRGIVIRVGGGGPFSYYKVTERNNDFGQGGLSSESGASDELKPQDSQLPPASKDMGPINNGFSGDSPIL